MAIPVEEKIATREDVLAAVDDAWQRMEAVVLKMGPVLDSGPDAGGWTPRQVLSHLIGSWELDAARMGFYLDDKARANVPIAFHEVYWKPEYETAPIKSFYLRLKAAYLGERALIESLTPEELASVGRGRGGDSTLAE